MTFEGDLPYKVEYPPKFFVHEDEARRQFVVRPYEERNIRTTAELAEGCEKRKILIEAYRGMRNCFGSVLAFSEPKRSCSFVFRSEREFLQSYDERFAWCVHFYQCAVREGEHRAERYAGFLFLRPWNIHVIEALKRPAYRTADLRTREPESLTPEDLCYCEGVQTVVPPAICEGYLRPPVSLVRSPFYSQCLDFYARPYDVLPFVSIPFFASQFGAACGHCSLAASLMISKIKVVLSPYELAVAASAIVATQAANGQHKGKTHGNKAIGAQQTSFYPITKFVVKTAPLILKKYCHANARVECFRNPEYENHPELLDSHDEREFSERLCSYLYQGIPLLYLVDPIKLYDERDDHQLAEVAAKEPVNSFTPEEKFHVILIHSLARPSNARRPYFVFSDTTNLHLKGDIFHWASCRRLWLSRLKPNPAAVAVDLPIHELGPLDHRCTAIYVVCLPEEFERTYTDIERECVRNQKEKDFTISLRDRSQLRGYLLWRVFPGEYQGMTTSPSFKKEIRKFREYVRDMDIPPFVWLVEREIDRVTIPASSSPDASDARHWEPHVARGHVVGEIWDIRSERRTSVKGDYNTQTQSISIEGTKWDGNRIEASLGRVGSVVRAHMRVL